MSDSLGRSFSEDNCQQLHSTDHIVGFAQEEIDLSNGGASDLQEATVGQRQEQRGVHEQKEHQGVSNARQQQLPCLPFQQVCGGVHMVRLSPKQTHTLDSSAGRALLQVTNTSIDKICQEPVTSYALAFHIKIMCSLQGWS